MRLGAVRKRRPQSAGRGTWPARTFFGKERRKFFRLEVCGVWFFPFLLRSCVSKLDSCSLYDSRVQKNYRLLILFNFCHKSRRMQININISKALRWKITPTSALGPVPIENNHSCSCSSSCWKTPTPAGVDSCTPASVLLCFSCGRPHFLAQKNFGIFKIFGVSARTRGLSRCADILRTRREGSIFLRFCADVFYRRPLIAK